MEYISIYSNGTTYFYQSPHYINNRMIKILCGLIEHNIILPQSYLNQSRDIGLCQQQTPKNEANNKEQDNNIIRDITPINQCCTNRNTQTNNNRDAHVNDDNNTKQRPNETQQHVDNREKYINKNQIQPNAQWITPIKKKQHQSKNLTSKISTEKQNQYSILSDNNDNELHDTSKEKMKMNPNQKAINNKTDQNKINNKDIDEEIMHQYIEENKVQEAMIIQNQKDADEKNEEMNAIEDEIQYCYKKHEVLDQKLKESNNNNKNKEKRSKLCQRRLSL